MKFKTFMDYDEWMKDNLQQIANTLLKLSGCDLRKMKSTRWDESDSIWAMACNKLFRHKQRLGKWFLFSTWRTSDQLQQTFARTSRTRHLPIRDLNDEGRRYCVCNMPWNEKTDPKMVECEKCLKWYHFICINVQESRDLTFVCHSCGTHSTAFHDNSGSMTTGSGTESVSHAHAKGSIQDIDDQTRKPNKNETKKSGPSQKDDDHTSIPNKNNNAGHDNKSGPNQKDDPTKNNNAGHDNKSDPNEKDDDHTSIPNKNNNAGHDNKSDPNEKDDDHTSIPNKNNNAGHRNKLGQDNNENSPNEDDNEFHEDEQDIDDEEFNFDNDFEDLIYFHENKSGSNQMDDDAESAPEEDAESAPEEDADDDGNPGSMKIDEDLHSDDDGFDDNNMDSEHFGKGEPFIKDHNDEGGNLDPQQMDKDGVEYHNEAEGFSSDDDFQNPRDINKEQNRPKRKKENSEEQRSSKNGTESKGAKFVNEYLSKQPKQFTLLVKCTDWNNHTYLCQPTEGKRCEVEHKKNDRHFRPGTDFHDMISKYFFKQNKYCCLTTEKTLIRADSELVKSNKLQFLLYMNCKNPTCPGEWSFKLDKIPKVLDQGDLKFQVVQRNQDTLRHDVTVHIARCMKGEELKKTQEDLRDKTAMRVRMERIGETDFEAFKGGNWNYVKTLGALRNAKYKDQHKEDICKDKILDMLVSQRLIQNDDKSFKDVPGFVQQLSLHPLQCVLFSDHSLRILHSIIKASDNCYLQIDATGKLIKKLPEPFKTGDPLVYSLLAPGANKGIQPFPLLQFFSSSGTFEDISSCLLQYMETYRKSYRPNKPFYGIRKIEVDFSKPLIYALVLVFQRTTMEKYMIMLWKAAVHLITEEEKKMIFAIHCCRIHIKRCVRSQIQKRFPGRQKHSRAAQEFWETWLSHFVCGRTIRHFYRRCKDAIVISGTRFLTDDVRERVNSIDNLTCNIQSMKDSFVYRKLDGAHPFWERSPFGQYAGHLTDAVQASNLHHLSSLKGEPGVVNPYYSKELMEYFKIHIMPYYPLITRMIYQSLSIPQLDDTTNRIEGFQNIIKNYWLNGDPVFPGAFIRSMYKFHKGSWKMFECSLEGNESTCEGMGDETGQDDIPPPPPSKEGNKQTSQRRSKLKRDLSPECYPEQFKKGRSKFQPRKATFVDSLSFVPYGCSFAINNETYQMVNTCNFDNTLMILQILAFHNAVGQRWFEGLRGDPEGMQLHRVLSALQDGQVGIAKKIWVMEMLRKKLGKSGGVLNLKDGERDHSIEPMSRFLMTRRTRRCLEPTCVAFQSKDNPNNELDTDDVGIYRLYRISVAQFINCFDAETMGDGPDNRCHYCKEISMVKFRFLDIPLVIFYALQIEGKYPTTSRSLPLQQYIGGVQYNVIAYTLWIAGDTEMKTSHYVAIILDNGISYYYDGLGSSLTVASESKHRYLSMPVSTVWLVKS